MRAAWSIPAAILTVAVLAAAIPNEKDLDPVLDDLCANKIDSVTVTTIGGATCVIILFLDGSSQMLCDRNPTE